MFNSCSSCLEQQATLIHSTQKWKIFRSSTFAIGFPGGSDGKESACGRPRFDPWVGKIPWRKEWISTPVFLPGECHGQRSLVGYSPKSRKESDMTEQLTLSHLRWEAENHIWVYAFLFQEQFCKSSSIIFNLSRKYEEINSSQEKRFPFLEKSITTFLVFLTVATGRVGLVLC